ncbi:MAG: right-handed parallel beta-helix repeat-containing protein, partial [Actinomycetota bacterium]|nr:right-handed parallel beta-helix repeat-containing protein [Actinomycetota bacterium]
AAGRADTAAPGGRTWHVSADGATEADGSRDRPFGSIDLAVAEARAGDTVVVGPGTYPGFSTTRSGRPDAPVRIVGSAAVIRGDGDGHLVQVNHDHITIEGFEIARADILVWMFQATGVRIVNNVLRDAAGECVRVKYFSTGNEIAGNRIERCGRDFDAADDEKSGEGIYIGTSPEQVQRNPTEEPDGSNDNWIHDNVITSPAECVDIKEGASGNLVESNVCSGGEDPDGAGFSARGNGNIFRANTSTGNKGAGIRLGGDDEADGLDNVVVGNRLVGNRGYGVKIQREPQRQICGNEVADNDEKPSNIGIDPTDHC